MHYAPLFEYLPDISSKETRGFWIAPGHTRPIPPGEYILVEYYCLDPKCDCRRVMLHVMSERERKIVAVINFGWESTAFYEKWLGFADKEVIHDLKGPCLNMGGNQAFYAPELLAEIQEFALSNREYVNILKKHYEQFKREVLLTRKASLQVSNGSAQAVEKTGRNDLCVCGSGRKYKKCCGVK